MGNLKIFDNDEFGVVRTVMIDGEPWFVGKDVARALGYANPGNAAPAHVDNEDKLNTQIEYAGQRRDVTVINESGLYALIFGSGLDSAKRFKHWVTSEVLPALRKSGAYTVVERNSYDAKSTSVGEIVNLLKVLRESMKDRQCKPDDVAVMIDRVCNQFGVLLPDVFLAQPALAINSEVVSNEELAGLTKQLMETAHQMRRGLAVTNKEFESFCMRNKLDVRQYGKWLLYNGYIILDASGKSSVPIKINGKSVRCVIFSRKEIGA